MIIKKEVCTKVNNFFQNEIEKLQWKKIDNKRDIKKLANEQKIIKKSIQKLYEIKNSLYKKEYK